MKTGRTELWTIHQLSAEVERVLAVDYEGSRNGRVRDIPDLRTIRYYTTAGLLERPAEMRGRTALYGRRHLLQLVAIKKLQARAESDPGSGADRGCHRRDAPTSRWLAGRGGCGDERGLRSFARDRAECRGGSVLEISAGAGPHPAAGD